MFLVVVPILVPYWSSLGLSMSEILWIQAIFGVSVAIFEFPTGYVADIFGRKISVVIGSFINGIGFSVLPFATDFWHLVGFEVLIAFGSSLISGADLALVYDSIEDEKTRLKELGKVNQWGLVGEAVASILTSLLVIFSFSHVLWAQAFFGWIPFIISLFFIEPNIHNAVAQPQLVSVKRVFSHLLTSSHTLLILLINSVIWGLSSYCVVWLLQAHWKISGVPLSMFGVVWCSIMLIAAASSRLTHEFEKRIGIKNLLLISAVLPCIGYFCMSFSVGIVGLLASILFYISRGISTVVYNNLFNSYIPSDIRASANSIRSLIFRLSYGVIGPITGISIDQFGLQRTLGGVGLVFSILIPTLLFKLNKAIK